MKRLLVLILVVGCLAMALLVGLNSHLLGLFYRKHFGDEFFIDPTAEIIPDNNYVVELWVPRLPIGAAGDYEVYLEDLLRDFRLSYSNVKINTRVLDLLDAEAELQAALDKGTPPDIYFSVYEDYAKFSSLQIPMQDFFTEEEQLEYYSVALKSFSDENNLWGIPQYLCPKYFVVKENIELDNWNDLLVAIKPGDTKYADTYVQGLWAQFCSPRHLLSLSEADYVMWIEQVNALKEVYNTNKITKENAMALFWNNQASVVGPVNSYMAQFLRNNSSNRLYFVDPFVRIDAAGLVLFRQNEYQGHDHTKAAVTLAKHLNAQMGLHQVFCTSASKVQAERAYQEIDLTGEELVRIKEQINSGKPARHSSISEAFKERDYLERIAKPLWGQFINNEISAEIFLERLLSEII